jgi:hypothetical protein
MAKECHKNGHIASESFPCEREFFGCGGRSTGLPGFELFANSRAAFAARLGKVQIACSAGRRQCRPAAFRARRFSRPRRLDPPAARFEPERKADGGSAERAFGNRDCSKALKSGKFGSIQRASFKTATAGNWSQAISPPARATASRLPRIGCNRYPLGRRRPVRPLWSSARRTAVFRYIGTGDPPCGSPAHPPMCGPRSGDVPAGMAPIAASRSRKATISTTQIECYPMRHAAQSRNHATHRVFPQNLQLSRFLPPKHPLRRPCRARSAGRRLLRRGLCAKPFR